MEKFMRKMPTISIFVAMAIQLERVAGFGERIGAGVMSWVFAFFLAGSIFGLSFWDARASYTVTASLEDKRQYAAQLSVKRASDAARREARTWLVLFVLIDGLLNLSETMTNLPANIDMWHYAGALVYGVFPTLAAYGLGRLQAYIERIPALKGRSWLDKLADALDGLFASKADKAGKQDGRVASNNSNLQEQGSKLAGANDKMPRKNPQALRGQAVQEEALLAMWRDNPQASDQQVAGKFGVTRQAVQGRRKALIEKGSVKMTPQGVEIVGILVSEEQVVQA